MTTTRTAEHHIVPRPREGRRRERRVQLYKMAKMSVCQSVLSFPPSRHGGRGTDASTPPGIIVKFVRRMDKEEMLMKRRVKRNLSTRHMGMNMDVPVYINESLTMKRRQMFNAARKVKREKHYKYLWVRNGKIFLRKDDGDKVSKSIVFLTVAVMSVVGEPPVDYSTTQQDVFAPPSLNAPSASYGVPPSSAYGPPTGDRFAGHRQTTAVLRPSANYGVPSSTYGAPVTAGHRGASRFGGHGDHGGFRRPSSNYGTPSSGYGAPIGGYVGGYDDGSSEPASYQFSYHVQDAESGNDFGHQESRDGHVAKGIYMVLLPDGRRQIVEYTADESGYHPNVRYEGTATGGGYPGSTGAGFTGSSGGYRY